MRRRNYIRSRKRSAMATALAKRERLGPEERLLFDFALGLILGAAAKPPKESRHADR